MDAWISHCTRSASGRHISVAAGVLGLPTDACDHGARARDAHATTPRPIPQAVSTAPSWSSLLSAFFRRRAATRPVPRDLHAGDLYVDDEAASCFSTSSSGAASIPATRWLGGESGLSRCGDEGPAAAGKIVVADGRVGPVKPEAQVRQDLEPSPPAHDAGPGATCRTPTSPPAVGAGRRLKNVNCPASWCLRSIPLRRGVHTARAEWQMNVRPATPGTSQTSLVDVTSSHQSDVRSKWKSQSALQKWGGLRPLLDAVK